MLYKISRLSGRPTGYMLLPFGLPTEESVVLSRVSDEIPLGEGDVEDGGVIVDELHRVVQLILTPEIELFYILFQRSLSILVQSESLARSQGLVKCFLWKYLLKISSCLGCVV